MRWWSEPAKLCLFIAMPEVTGAYCFPPVQLVLTALASRLQLCATTYIHAGDANYQNQCIDLWV